MNKLKEQVTNLQKQTVVAAGGTGTKKRMHKATPLIMEDLELQLLIEYWQRVLQSNNEILSDLSPSGEAEYGRVVARLAYAEKRFKYWLSIQARREMQIKTRNVSAVRRSFKTI